MTNQPSQWWEHWQKSTNFIFRPILVPIFIYCNPALDEYCSTFLVLYCFPTLGKYCNPLLVKCYNTGLGKYFETVLYLLCDLVLGKYCNPGLPVYCLPALAQHPTSILYQWYKPSIVTLVKKYKFYISANIGANLLNIGEGLDHYCLPILITLELHWPIIASQCS